MIDGIAAQENKRYYITGKRFLRVYRRYTYAYTQ